MKSRMNKLMSLCLVAMMGTTFIPQPIQAEEVGEFEEESFEEATVEFEEATFEEEKQNVEASPENSVTADFEYKGLKYKVTDENKKEVEVIGFADSYQQTGYKLRIPDTVSKQDESDEEYTVTSIGEKAFNESYSIHTVNFPKSIKVIGKLAFGDCAGIEQLSLPDSLETIGESAFEGCFHMDGIDFPSSLKTIGKSAFYRCGSLKKIDFDYYSNPKNLKTIGEYAFAGCSKIEEIVLPEGLETIGKSAFALCPDSTHQPRLKYINIPSTVKELEPIFGASGLYGDDSPFLDEGALIFFGDTPPNMDDDFLDVISDENHKPIIYFPDNEVAKENYAGANTPFVKNGFINPDLLDSYYEFIQFCPKGSAYIGRLDYLPWRYFLNVDSDNNKKIVKFDQNDNCIKNEGTTGETILDFSIDAGSIKLTSDACRIKVKVDHRYAWQIEKWPTKDQPGSMFQECRVCHDMKESVTIPPTGGGSGGGSTGGSTSGGSGGSSSGNTGDSGGSTSKPTNPNAPTQQVENAVYRAYNPYNGEHLYTTNYGEFKVITKNGWNDEGIAFMSESKEKGQAVYRVYNPNSGLHHYTTDVNEKNALVSLGWNDEGVAFYTSKNPKDTPVYRVYNENDGNHHYTMNANEALALISMGWKNEGIAFLTAPMK
ncbi:leucine-rich repeat domain-containing protein [Allobaculum stercoricanis]|uniref:leucine-rich repeat domain-containing protein n=1 Tax=Allobaculum stercoricanis TaxID=174709 RepID=UPI00248D590B|nr:leucine-rich repeat domain-containing protein [Allobaculum stercoricanis]